jgi:hypothetical protein
MTADTLQQEVVTFIFNLGTTESPFYQGFPVQATYANGRIEFAFAFNTLVKDEVKAMTGSRWHPDRKVWSADDCYRNRFQMAYLQGHNPYEWFDREVEHVEYERPLRSNQVILTDAVLTYRFQLWAAEMALGKTLAAIEAMERSGFNDWWWVSQTSALKAAAREFVKWNCRTLPQTMTYNGLVTKIKTWVPGTPPPHGVVFDEAHNLKTAASQRSQAAQYLTNAMRAAYGNDCYIIGMTGSPAAKKPVDWWSQAEIICPGFLREGRPDAFHRRLGFFKHVKDPIGQEYWKPAGWRDNPEKCDVCGCMESDGIHIEGARDYHAYRRSTNEVSLLYDRLQGLVIRQFKKDYLDLPEKVERIVRCRPSPSILRAAQVIARGAPSGIVAATLLRELSDGFQYTDIPNGTTKCGHCNGTKEIEEWTTSGTNKVPCPTCDATGEVTDYKRETIQASCPKDTALGDLLDENEEIGRVVVYAGFKGSVDRAVKVCQQKGWLVIRVDGRGWLITDKDNNTIVGIDALDIWANMDEYPQVAFVGHPMSGGVGLNLCEAQMLIWYSADFNPTSFVQASDRTNRPGNLATTIVYLYHLPSDERIINLLKENLRIERMTLGEVQAALEVTTTDYDY